MSSGAEVPVVSKHARRTGMVMSVLLSLMLLFSVYMKFTSPPEVLEGFEKFGYPQSVLFPIGVVELVCTVLYLMPRTSVVGAILLTGYFGGAIATHVRISDIFYAPVIMGIVAWLALFLRDRKVRALIPFTK